MLTRVFRLVAVVVFTLGALAALRLTLAAATANQPPDAGRIPRSLLRDNSVTEFPIITHTASQEWVGISGDCIAFRDSRVVTGGVYLYNLTSGQMFTVSEEPDEIRKVAVSQGVVVWRSDRAGAQGLWGYYNPSCSDAGPFTSTQIITPFHIVSRANAHAPALSGEMLTFDTWAPKGEWYVALVVLDANDNGVPDASEPGYDPADANLIIPVSSPAYLGPGIVQRLSDVYADDDYKIACWYDNTGEVDSIECNDLRHWNEPDPWKYRFEVATSTLISLTDFSGIIAVHRNLVIWTDARDFDLSGFDIYIADLDVDKDGTLNHEDGDATPVFSLVNRPYAQEHPDIWWPFVVWSDRRNHNQPDIYAYDLSLDSDGDGIYNWQDADRFCIDPAEFPVTLNPAWQIKPEIYSGTVVWQDYRHGNWDIYGAYLQPVQLQPRTPVSGSSEDRAAHWLGQHTLRFSRTQDIPGYIAATGLITRYKSFMQMGVEQLRQAWYPAITGTYLAGFDYCYYGTPDQKRYLGRFGRGFTYDQALALIARTMLSQTAEAQLLARYVASFQNSGQLTSTAPGSFGFSFNGQGHWGEKDSYYDMDYLRTGANAWLGYGLLFYTRQTSDTQFMNVVTRTADYLLGLQVTNPITDPRFGLFLGGYGSWAGSEFIDQNIGWASTEHNIDTYFFLRDLGEFTGNSRYTTAASLLKANMPKLWDAAKGRLNQGMSITGALDTGDALDTASWGAMYWLAVGNFVSATQSLEYADHAYHTIVTASPTLSIEGYKPYSGTVDGVDWAEARGVWSEGSIGVAMAHLKLGNLLLSRCAPHGGEHIQKAHAIVAEMESLQQLDPLGGLLYMLPPAGRVITGFPEAPSAAGTTWLLMMQRALQDGAQRDAFWSVDKGAYPPLVAGSCKAYLPLVLKNAVP